MDLRTTAGPGRPGVLFETEERALEGNGRWPFCACAVPLGVSTWGSEGVLVWDGVAAGRAGVASWRGSGGRTPFAVFVSREADTADKETYA